MVKYLPQDSDNLRSSVHLAGGGSLDVIKEGLQLWGRAGMTQHRGRHAQNTTPATTVQDLWGCAHS